MAHSPRTPSDEKLADWDVITVLVMGVPQVFAHERGWAFAAVKGDGLRRHVGEPVLWRRLQQSEVRVGWRCEGCCRGAMPPLLPSKNDGSVVAWGIEGRGGHLDAVKSDLQCGVASGGGNFCSFRCHQGRLLHRHLGGPNLPAVTQTQSGAS